MLNSYKVTSIRKKTGMVIFGSPQTVVDEGDIYRIAELHVISKGMIEKCEKEDGVVSTITQFSALLVIQFSSLISIKKQPFRLFCEL